MSFRKEGFIDCVGLGAVNVVLADRVVLQGQIIKERNHNIPNNGNDEVENEFITLELSCAALIIRDNAQLADISPVLYAAGDRVRINISEIIAIGPSNGCPDEVVSATTSTV